MITTKQKYIIEKPKLSKKLKHNTGGKHLNTEENCKRGKKVKNYNKTRK
jgi:hypothetical protein